MKKFMMVIGAMLLTVSLNAQTTLKILPFSIEPGEKKTVTLDLDNPDFVASGFSCGILLPEGLDIAKNKKGKYDINVNKDEERGDDHTVTSELHPDGTVTMVYVSLSAADIWGTEGAVVDIPFVASETSPGRMFSPLPPPSIAAVEADMPLASLPMTITEGESTPLESSFE